MLHGLYCGLGNGTIKKWGKAMPSADRLKRVADFFDVSLEYLMVNRHSPSIRQGRNQLPFARNLKRIREAKQLSFDDLSKKTSFSVEEIKGFESGLLVPDDTLTELSRVLDITEDDLEQNDFVKRSLQEVELLEWIDKRNQYRSMWDEMKFLFAYTDRFDSEMRGGELSDCEKKLDHMKVVLREQKREFLEILRSVPLMDVIDIYGFFIEKKILDLSADVKPDNSI